MKDQTLHLVYVTDIGYLMPTTVSLASAYAWCDAPARLTAHIIDIGIPDVDWEHWVVSVRTKLPEAAQIIRHKLPFSALDGFPAYCGNAATCARAYIPDLMPDVAWCLYVDGDTMFFDDPLKATSIFDDQFAFQAHRDRLEAPPAEKSHKDWFVERGMVWDLEQYGCAGVLLMNLKWFRERGIEQKLIDFMKRYQDSKWPDQDALYWVCRGHIKFLPDEWGMMDDHLWLSNGNVPACLHYVEHKPWNFTRLARGYRSGVDIEWLRCARHLTHYTDAELLRADASCSFVATCLGWLWRFAFKVASRKDSWRLSHGYRLMWILPRHIKHHISYARLKARLAQLDAQKRDHFSQWAGWADR